MTDRVATKCRCVGNQESGHKCNVLPSLPYDPHFGVENEDEKRILEVILRSHVAKDSEKPSVVLPLERHEAPPRILRLRYKVVEGVYGKRPSTSGAAKGRKPKTALALEAQQLDGTARPATSAALTASDPSNTTGSDGPDKTLIRFISLACQNEPDDYGMIQLGQAFARRALPWSAQMCPQAMELVEALRVRAERAREGQLVNEHQSDQLGRMKDFMRQDKKRSAAWFDEQKAGAGKREHEYRKSLRHFRREENERLLEEWHHEEARTPGFEEAEYARVNAMETVNLENNLIAEATIKVIGFGSVNTRALKRTLEDGRMRAAEEAEHFRSERVFQREEAYCFLWFVGARAKMEEAAKLEQARIKQINSAEVTALTFTHGELDKVNEQIYDHHWQDVLKFERVEARRVEKELKVQEALAHASCVYIMHVLRQHSRPQHEKAERTDMFWEIKHVAQLTSLKRKVAEDQRLMDIVDTQRAQRNLKTLLREYRRGVEEEGRLWYERSKRSLEERQQHGESHVRAQLRKLKDEAKARWRHRLERVLGNHKREAEDAAGALHKEVVTCREMEEREALRLILEAHQRRHQEDGRAESDRQRLNQLIAHWRAQFAELIEHVRQEVVTWVGGQKREVMGWVAQADDAAKDTETKDLQRANRAARHELERSVAATRALVDQGLNQLLAVMDRLHASEARQVAADEGSPQASLVESGKMEHGLLVEATKIVNKLGEMMLVEDDKNERACKDMHHVREQHIRDEKARFKAEWHEFRDGFVQGIENYINALLVKNDQTRATLHSFFRTEDNIFREMLLEEEQEGATWQQAQEGQSDEFYREHRQRGQGFVHYLEDLKRHEAAGSNATEGGDEQGSLATVGSLGTMAHDDEEGTDEWGEEGEGQEEGGEEEGEDATVQNLRELLQTEQDENGRVSVSSLWKALEPAAGDLSMSQRRFVLACCTHDASSVVLSEWLARAGPMLRVLQQPPDSGEESSVDQSVDCLSVLQAMAAEEARLALSHLHRALGAAESRMLEQQQAKHKAKPLKSPKPSAQQGKVLQAQASAHVAEPPCVVWTHEMLMVELRPVACWSPYVSHGDMAVIDTLDTTDADGRIDEKGLQEVLVELRLTALQQATAWVSGHSDRSLRAYLFAAGRRAHQARAAKATQQPGTTQAGGEEGQAETQMEKEGENQEGVTVETKVAAMEATKEDAKEEGRSSAGVVVSLRHMAELLEGLTSLGLSKAQRLAALSEMGNLYSPTCMMDGHPAYPLKRWAHLLSVWLKREFAPRRLLALPALLSSAEYQSLLSSASLAHRSAYESAVLSMLAPLELPGMQGRLPVTVVRNCLVSGQHIRGAKPGMADVALLAACMWQGDRMQWALLEEEEEEEKEKEGGAEQQGPTQRSAFGRVVLCRSSEALMDYRAVLGHVYETLVMLLRSAWVSRSTVHKVEGAAAVGVEAMHWSSLLSARQRRLLRRGDWMRQLSREQWQLIYSRLLHERHARRVTNEMLLRVQDTDTTKLAEALLKRTEEPLQTVQAEGESMLSGVMAGQQRLVQAFDAYRHSLDNIVMDDAHSQLEHLGEAVNLLATLFHTEWRSMMVNFKEVFTWVREHSVEDLSRLDKWKLSCTNAYKTAQADDELRRRQEEVLLTLALMDTSEGTANFTDRLTDEAEKICKEAGKAQALVVRDLLNVLPSVGPDGRLRSNAEAAEEEAAKAEEAPLADNAEGTHMPTDEASASAERLTNEQRKSSTGKVVVQEERRRSNPDSEDTAKEAPKGRYTSADLRKIREDLLEMCNTASKKVQAITVASENKLVKLEAAIAEQLQLTESQQATRLKEYNEKQSKAMQERFKVAQIQLHSAINIEATRWEGVLEGRIPEFCVLLGDEEVRLSGRWEEIEMREKHRFKTKHDKLAVQSADRCMKLATSADMEQEFVREQVHAKAVACKDLIIDRCAMHTKDFEECLRRASELAMEQFAKWQDLITKRRIHEEVRTVLNLTASRVELVAEFEANWLQCKASLAQTLGSNTDKATKDCAARIEQTRAKYEAVASNHRDTSAELLAQVQEAKTRLLEDLAKQEPVAKKEKKGKKGGHSPVHRPTPSTDHATEAPKGEE